MFNTLLLAVTALVSACTPILLALINNRQAAETTAKVQRLEQLHTSLVDTIAAKR